MDERTDRDVNKALQGQDLPQHAIGRDGRLIVVGIGVAAGGLTAVQDFLKALPAETGMAFVIVTRGDVYTEAPLPGLLQQWTAMPIHQVTARTMLEADHLYVIAPNQYVLVTGTFLDTQTFDPPVQSPTPLDFFFRSLASFQENAFGVILGGADVEGTLGVKAIKEQGGWLFVQDPNEAADSSLPLAMIEAGLSDIVLPARQLAEKLLTFRRNDLQTENSELQSVLDQSAQAHSDLQNLVAAAEIVTLFLDGDLRLKRYSPNATQLFDLTPHEEGRPISQLGNTLDYESLASDSAKVLETLSPIEREVQDVEGRWLLVHMRPYQTIYDRGAGVVLTFTDITERKFAEEELRKSEQKYRMLFNSIDEGFCIVEVLFDENERPLDYRFLEINAAFERQTGIVNGVGRRMREIEPRHEEHWFEIYGRVASTGEGARFQQYAHHLGQRWYDVYAFRIGAPHERQVGILFQDISERIRNEERLRGAEERLRLIVESAKGYAVFTTDAEGFINTWNMGASEIFGWGEADILGQNAAVLFTPEDRATGEPQKELETARTQGIAPDIRWHQRKDGTRVFIHGEVRPLHNGQRNGFVKIGRDLTAQRQAEEALHKHQDQLQSLNETLEQQIQEKTSEVRQVASELVRATQQERHRISHLLHDDLQQRVYAIQMQMTFLNNMLQEEQEAARTVVVDVANQLDEILELTRQLSIDLSPPILRGEGLWHAINWLAERMQQRYGLTIDLQGEGSFVIPDKELHVLLFNCVRELLFNIVKHAGASQAVVTLERMEDNRLRIEVRDNGKGFPADQTEQLSKGEDTLPHSFGLATIRHQLSLFNGTLEIHSTPGAGTQAVITV